MKRNRTIYFAFLSASCALLLITGALGGVFLLGGFQVKELEAQRRGPAVALSSIDQSFTQAIEKAKEGVVQVVCHNSFGTGSIVKVNGVYYVTTNRHVVFDEKSKANSCLVGQSVELYMPTRDRIEGKVLYIDEKVDCAIIEPAVTQFEGRSLPYLEIGDPNALKLGQWVIAIGHPLGLLNSASTGIVSGMYRSEIEGTSNTYLQTDAAINKGNSGGPLINLNGEVIAMNTWKLASADLGVESLAFAIPVDVVISRIPRGKRYYEPGVMGIMVEELDAAKARGLGVSPGSIAITKLAPGGAAENAQLQGGDIILSFDGNPIRNTGHLNHYLATKWVGDTVEVVINRRGRTMPVKVTLGKISVIAMNLEQLGLRCETRSGRLTITGVKVGSVADGAELNSGDVILSVGRDVSNLVSVKSPDELERVLKSVANAQGYAIIEVKDKSGSHRYRRMEFE